MRTFLGLIAWLLVVYGPMACRDPYTKFGCWCLAGSGDWIYRAERRMYAAHPQKVKEG